MVISSLWGYFFSFVSSRDSCNQFTLLRIDFSFSTRSFPKLLIQQITSGNYRRWNTHEELLHIHGSRAPVINEHRILLFSQPSKYNLTNLRGINFGNYNNQLIKRRRSSPSNERHRNYLVTVWHISVQPVHVCVVRANVCERS